TGGADRRPEQTPAGHMHEPLTIHSRTRLLSDLEPDHRPLPELTGDPGAGAGSTGPAELRPAGAGIQRLCAPTQPHRYGEGTRYRPLDVGTHGERGRVHVHNTTCGHGDLPGTNRHVFPYEPVRARSNRAAREQMPPGHHDDPVTLVAPANRRAFPAPIAPMLAPMGRTGGNGRPGRYHP